MAPDHVLSEERSLLPSRAAVARVRWRPMEIARDAYRLLEDRGRVHGHALDDRVAAERALTRGTDDEDG